MADTLAKPSTWNRAGFAEAQASFNLMGKLQAVTTAPGFAQSDNY
jgi:hypothetical protein